MFGNRYQLISAYIVRVSVCIRKSSLDEIGENPVGQLYPNFRKNCKKMKKRGTFDTKYMKNAKRYWKRNEIFTIFRPLSIGKVYCFCYYCRNSGGKNEAKYSGI